MFDIKDFFKITLTILGTVIGAGFISGREILTFFYGQNVLLSTLIFLSLFFLSLCVLFYDVKYTSSKWFAFSKPFVYAGDLVLSSGMLSALDGFYWQIFPDLKPYPILSIICIIISNVIISDGIKGLKNANFILTPIIILITVFALSLSKNFDFSAGGDISAVKLCGYVGLNVFTSSLVFVSVSEKASFKTSFTAAISASVILAGLIFLILSALQNSSDIILQADMPLLKLLEDNAFIKWCFTFAILFGVFTTLLSSHYPLSELVKTKKNNFLTQALLSLLIFGISRLGFYNIVSFIYPVMGGAGIVYLAVTCFSEAVFRSVRRKSTSRRQVCKELPCSSLRDRV